MAAKAGRPLEKNGECPVLKRADEHTRANARFEAKRKGENAARELGRIAREERRVARGEGDALAGEGRGESRLGRRRRVEKH